MCLSVLNFSLEYNTRTKIYYGTGYKSYGLGCVPAKNKWIEATGWGQNLEKAIKSGISTEESNFTTPTGDYKLDNINRTYIAGFHIWLNETDAKLYTGTEKWKVQFKEVLGFGTNYVSSKCNDKTNGPCVIARYIKLIEQIPNTI